MFDTPQARIGAALSIAVLAFALLKGDEPERTGGAAYGLAWFASLLIQGNGVGSGVAWGLAAVDFILLGVFSGLAWKSRRAWPVWASGLQSLVVMSHLLTFIDARPPLMAFYVVVNLASYGILLTLAVGVWLAWRDRRAAGVE